jgi:hypothetical protein
MASDQKAQALTINAAEQKKHQKSLSPEQKGQVMTINVAAHNRKYQLFSPEKKSETHKKQG